MVPSTSSSHSLFSSECQDILCQDFLACRPAVRVKHIQNSRSSVGRISRTEFAHRLIFLFRSEVFIMCCLVPLAVAHTGRDTCSRRAGRPSQNHKMKRQAMFSRVSSFCSNKVITLFSIDQSLIRLFVFYNTLYYLTTPSK